MAKAAASKHQSARMASIDASLAWRCSSVWHQINVTSSARISGIRRSGGGAAARAIIKRQQRHESEIMPVAKMASAAT